MQAGTLLLVARILGAQQFGAFVTLAAAAVLLGSLSTFGMQVMLLRNVSRNANSEFLTLQMALPLTLLCSTLLFVVFLVTSMLHWGEHKLPTFTVVAIGAAEIILMPLLALRAAGQHGLGRVAVSQLTMLLPLALRLLIATGVLVLSPSDPLFVYAIGYMLASALALSLSLLLQSSRWPRLPLWHFPDRRTITLAGGYAVLNLNRIGPTELDKALAGGLLPLDSAGTYSAAARLIGATTLPVTAMNLSALPRLFREHDEESERAGKLLLTMYAAAFCYSIAVAIFIWFVAPIVPHVFGADYDNIEEMIRLLCFVVPGMALRLVGGNVLMALGRPWVRASVEGAGMIALAFAAIFLTGRLGHTGMIAALACSEWGMAIVGAVLIRLNLNRSTNVLGARFDSFSGSSGHDNELTSESRQTKPPA